MPNVKDLKTKTIMLAGNEVTVSEASLRMGMRRDHLKAQGLRSLSDPGNEELTPLEQVFIVEIYPSMFACSSGELPSAMEMLDGMTELETDEWYVACVELNPHWFTRNEEDQPEIKKKSRSRRRSLRKTE